MDLLSFSLCWSPVLLLTVLAVFFRRPALDLSIYGTIFTLALAAGYFQTSLRMALLADLDGALTTLPLTLVLFIGILLSSLLSATGSLKRIVDWFMSGVRDAFHRSLLITLGVGNFMEGAGVIAEPVVAPMLTAAGVTPGGAAALSIVGYYGLMTLEMAGIIVAVLSLVTGLPLYDLGLASAWLSLPATLAMAACLPLFLSHRRWSAPGQPDTPLWPGKGPGLSRWALILGCGLIVACGCAGGHGLCQRLHQRHAGRAGPGGFFGAHRHPAHALERRGPARPGALRPAAGGLDATKYRGALKGTHRPPPGAHGGGGGGPGPI